MEKTWLNIRIRKEDKLESTLNSIVDNLGSKHWDWLNDVNTDYNISKLQTLICNHLENGYEYVFLSVCLGDWKRMEKNLFTIDYYCDKVDFLYFGDEIWLDDVNIFLETDFNTLINGMEMGLL